VFGGAEQAVGIETKIGCHSMRGDLPRVRGF
jgi:hypothetical protein